MGKLAKFANARLIGCFLITLALLAAALGAAHVAPGSLLAVTLYKAHLMALGGWGGYWLDRALFPYHRPHEYLHEYELWQQSQGAESPSSLEEDAATAVSVGMFCVTMLRRAIIVMACLVTVGLGA